MHIYFVQQIRQCVNVKLKRDEKIEKLYLLHVGFILLYKL